MQGRGSRDVLLQSSVQWIGHSWKKAICTLLFVAFQGIDTKVPSPAITYSSTAGNVCWGVADPCCCDLLRHSRALACAVTSSQWKPRRCQWIRLWLAEVKMRPHPHKSNGKQSCVGCGTDHTQNPHKQQSPATSHHADGAPVACKTPLQEPASTPFKPLWEKANALATATFLIGCTLQSWKWSRAQSELMSQKRKKCARLGTGTPWHWCSLALALSISLCIADSNVLHCMMSCSLQQTVPQLPLPAQRLASDLWCLILINKHQCILATKVAGINSWSNISSMNAL